MSDVTHILNAIEAGDAQVSASLLPLVYEELRKLAAAKLTQEKPGQTLQATALVHEAYLRLVDVEKAPHWNSRGHFFAAAAEAMRRILIDQARQKQSLRRGAGRERHDIDHVAIAGPEPSLDVLDDMSKLRLIWSLILMVPGWAMRSGFARLDSPETRSAVGGIVIGGLIGVLSGLAFGKAKGKWLDYVFGPELPCDRAE